jgi:succinate dehydrogenase / fumarate reductase cytochrome b subunit
MNLSAWRTGFEAHLVGLLGRSEKLSFYGASRGWGFVLTWAHRVTGLSLVLYMFFHVITLSGLRDPSGFAEKMAFFDNFFFTFLEWALAVPVVFHALNGCRLMLYEIFRVRQEQIMIRWVFLLSAIYVFTLGLVMLMGNQHVSTGVFWLVMAIASALIAAVVFRRIWSTHNALLWKLQRISGAFLLPMVCGHMFFMHLNYKVGHDVETILARMSSMGMRTIDFIFVVTVFFHAGFGLNTIIGDHVEDGRLRNGLKMLASFVVTFFAYLGVKLLAHV